jgi:transcriptional regulator with XRE-family HTH domain
MPTVEPVTGLSAVAAGNARALRARARLRQEDVARRAGLSRAVLASLETERRRVTLDDAVALCSGLNVTLAELLDGAPSEALAALGLLEE